MNECVKFLSPILPCRENLIKTLYNYIGYKDEVFPQCLFILGHKGTGKSKNNHSLLKYLKHNL
ncbi:origin recognition complex subunit 5-like [Ctenocephalides felis]|uniref:origin recognition complex subunit 5-like n=1 Tax=Ctenocephalides felis TaxID=7515 RepID=UPI000E6E274A|nr:origin recognition complex subunit 5-like [Ctenocephalides felis]